jgi:predicted MFS family arabinose efflux permease
MTRLPRVVWVLAAGTFMLGTSEFMIAGLLPETAAAMRVSVARAGLLITVFALGMIVGSPVMALATRRIEKRKTLVAALVIFAAGHVIAAVGASFALLLAARFLTALATGAFWAVAAVVATQAAGPDASTRALAVVMGA